MTNSQNNAERKYSDLRLLYQMTADGITFLKNQQWRVTNYALLLYGAIGGLGIHISKNPEGYKLPFLINSLAPIIIFIVNMILLGKFQIDIHKFRNLLERAEGEDKNYNFTDDYFNIKYKNQERPKDYFKNKIRIDFFILGVLFLVSGIGAILSYSFL